MRYLVVFAFLLGYEVNCTEGNYFNHVQYDLNLGNGRKLETIELDRNTAMVLKSNVRFQNCMGNVSLTLQMTVFLTVTSFKAKK